MRLTGKIVTWKDDQGYGFITPDNGGPQVFVHITAFLDAKVRPIVSDPVAFELTADERGRPQAKYVRREGAAFRLRSVDKIETALLALAGLFLAVAVGVAVTGYLPPAVPGLYLGASLVTFFMYRRDKRAARAGQWRTAESTLQMLALFGGWPGALMAQRILRHKSSKASFQLVFWFIVALNTAVFVWILTPEGNKSFHQTIQFYVYGR